MTASADSVATTEAAATDSTAIAGVIEVPRNIDFQMDANLKQVLFDKMTFNNMNGKLVVKDGKVDMKNLSMGTMGGNVVMNGYYSTANAKKPEMKAGFKLSDISFSQAYKELDMVQQLAPIFENLKGNFSGSINVLTDLDAAMSPVLETMQGDGSLSTRDLSLSGVKAIDQIADAISQPSLKEMKVKDMTLDFTIKDGRVETKPFDIKMGDYNLNSPVAQDLTRPSTTPARSSFRHPPAFQANDARSEDRRFIHFPESQCRYKEYGQSGT